MIAGAGEALDLDPELLDDIKTAVSEACNNVVMHAYPDGAGPLQTLLYALPDRVEVAVTDHGSGMAGAGAQNVAGLAATSEHMGLGLAVISALADRAEFRRLADGGTGVHMSFARRSVAGAGPGRPHAPQPLLDVPHSCELALHQERAPWSTGTGPCAGDTAPLQGDVCVVLSPPSLLSAVLGRTARALAAAAAFSLDRFADLYLITDELAAHAGALAAREELAFALTAQRGALELALAPLRIGARARIDGLRGGSLPLARLLDSLQVVPMGTDEALRALVAGR
jgi:serine/threonine-protein kinase RsbW